MQENEFEQNMQRRMEQLRLEPSGELWKKIAGQIEPKKQRKKRWIFFFFSMMCISGIAVYFAAFKQPSGNTIHSTVLVKANIDAAVDENATPNLKQQTEKITAINRPVVKLPAQTGINSDLAIAPIVLTELPVRKTTVFPKKLTTNNRHERVFDGENIVTTAFVASTATKQALQKANRLRQKPSVYANISPGVVETLIDEPIGETTIKEKLVDQRQLSNSVIPSPSVVSQPGAPTTKINFASVESVSETAEQAQLTNIDSAGSVSANLVKKTTTTNKWATSIWLAAGKSFLMHEGNPPQPGFDSQGNVANTGSGTSAGIANYVPSATTSGWYFATGLQFARNLSGKLSVESGLQYRLFTVSNAIGDQVVSPTFTNERVDSFKSGINKAYVTYFHQLSIPLSVSIQLAKAGGRDVLLNTGVVFSTLINSNALQFNATTNRYYPNNNLLNNTSVGLSAALLINLSGKNKRPLYIGPDFNYNLTAIRTTGLHAGMHPLLIGLRLQHRLQKK